MGYCTKKDLLTLVTYNSELQRLIEKANVDDDYVIQSIIECASGIVDNYVGVNDNANPSIKLITAKITAYYLFQRNNPEIPQPIKDGYQESMQMLVDMKRNNIKNPNVVSSKSSALNKKVSYESPLYLNY